MPRRARTDIVGQRFGRLVVTGLTASGGRRKAEAICDCGTHFTTEVHSIVGGRTKSCGCLRIKHGHAVAGVASPTYNSWAMMHDRCRNPNDERFAHYGGRGIKVCERWSSFPAFLEDMGERPPGRSIDRIDTDGNYEPGNCRWATVQEQNLNRRASITLNVGGEAVTLKEACRIFCRDYQRARAMIKKGFSPAAALLGEQIAYG